MIFTECKVLKSKNAFIFQVILHKINALAKIIRILLILIMKKMQDNSCLQENIYLYNQLEKGFN